jgi:predicted nucleic acid-binding protein
VAALRSVPEAESDAPAPLRIFCDADVLIAGAASTTGASHILLQLSELTLVQCLTSPQAVEEAERNLRAKLPAALPAFRLILDAAVEVGPSPPPSVLRACVGQAHAKDVAILAAAVSAGANFLTTFNTRHFRPRKAPPVILPPGKVLLRIRASLSSLLIDS